MALLEIRNLSIRFGAVRAVAGVDLSVESGEIVGLVGESGSGKSLTALAVMGLVGGPGVVQADCLRLGLHDLPALRPGARRRLLGRELAMIFQEPTTSLNPSFTIGFQLEEALAVHGQGDRRQRRHRAVALLEQVGIPDAAKRLGAYPHQLSGGMNQRVMIAMAIALDPRLLIADEPTTALDVTIQAQILRLLVELQQQKGMGLLFITHDLAVLAGLAHRVAVMYAGEVVETGAAAAVLEAPRHPYSAALLAALPEQASAAAGRRGRGRLAALPGQVPGPYERPAGCLLAPRCRFVQARCRVDHPALTDGVRCHFPLDPAGRPTGLPS